MLIPQVVVGCFETLSHDEHGWGAWLNWAQERGLVAGKDTFLIISFQAF